MIAVSKYLNKKKEYGCLMSVPYKCQLQQSALVFVLINAEYLPCKSCDHLAIHSTPHTCAILVNFYRPVVHLRHCLHLNVVPMTVVFPLPVDVCGEVFSHIV